MEVNHEKIKIFIITVGNVHVNHIKPAFHSERGFLFDKLEFLVNKIFWSVLAFEIELAEVHGCNAHTPEYDTARERYYTRQHQHRDAVPEHGANY